MPVKRKKKKIPDLSLPPCIASLHYIKPPKLALPQRWPLDQTCLNKKEAAHHWLSSFWIGLVSINPLMSYIKPWFTPRSPLSLASFFGCWEWQDILAVLASPRGKPAKYTRQNCWPAVEWRQGGGLVWLNFPTAYSFVMISLNLYAIWVFLLMNLSQDLTLVLLRYFGTLSDGYSLKGSNKKPSRHNS